VSITELTHDFDIWQTGFFFHLPDGRFHHTFAFVLFSFREIPNAATENKQDLAVRIDYKTSCGLDIIIKRFEIVPELLQIIRLDYNALMVFVLLQQFNIVEQQFGLTGVFRMNERSFKGGFSLQIGRMHENERALVNVYFIPLHERFEKSKCL